MEVPDWHVSRKQMLFLLIPSCFPLFLELKFGTPAQIKSGSLTSNSFPTYRSVIIQNLAIPPLPEIKFNPSVLEITHSSSNLNSG